jgi:UDP:flavonoid glycosyltransferase YjiC (YdhE family)
MRVLMCSTSGRGHFMPLLPFARALRDAGHELLVTAPESAADMVAGSGMDHWPCADIDRSQLAPVPANDDGAERQRAALAFADLGPRAALPGILAAIDTWHPDVVLREVAELGSLVAARSRAVPVVQLLYGLSSAIDDVAGVAPLVSRWSGGFGVPGEELVSVLADLPSLSLLPASYDLLPRVPHGAIHRYQVRPEAAGQLPDWWPGNADPLVYVSFGTEAHRFPFARAALRHAVEALAALPVRLLVTIGEYGEVGDWVPLGGNVRVERWVPQHSVLQAAAAVVCHAGSGTVLGALQAGVPLVAIPLFADQPDNAGRIEAAGAGMRVGAAPDGTVDHAALRAAVSRVLTEQEFRDRAQHVARDIAALPLAGDAVSLLEAMASTPRPARLASTAGPADCPGG